MIEVTTGAQPSSPRSRAIVLPRFATARRALVSVGIVATVFVWQIKSGFLATELAGTPDESAHFTTGVLLFDYVRRGVGQWPLDFARAFYQQYPKVALGHWPPLFYALQAAWYVLFGAHPWSMVLLLGAITAATACSLLHTVSIRHGLLFGAVSAALFLLNPLVRDATLQANSDMLLVLVSLGAIYAFSARRRTDAVVVDRDPRY